MHQGDAQEQDPTVKTPRPIPAETCLRRRPPRLSRRPVAVLVSASFALTRSGPGHVEATTTPEAHRRLHDRIPLGVGQRGQHQ